jgi:hypothetical protein
MMCHHPYHILCIRIIMRDMVEETAIGPLREGLAETLHSSLASRRIRALPTMPPCPHTQCVCPVMSNAAPSITACFGKNELSRRFIRERVMQV